MIYKPERKYELTIDNYEVNDFIRVWFRFNIRAEKLIVKIFQAMGFKKINNKFGKHSDGFKADKTPFNVAFAESMKAALGKGEFPTTIPYIPRFNLTKETIGLSRFTIAYLYKKGDNQLERTSQLEDSLMLLETTTEKREAVAWLVYFFKTKNLDEDYYIDVPRKASRTEAHDLIDGKKQKVVLRLPNPFGSFGDYIDLDDLDADVNRNLLYSEKANNSNISSSRQVVDEMSRQASAELPRQEESGEPTDDKVTDKEKDINSRKLGNKVSSQLDNTMPSQLDAELNSNQEGKKASFADSLSNINVGRIPRYDFKAESSNESEYIDSLEVEATKKINEQAVTPSSESSESLNDGLEEIPIIDEYDDSDLGNLSDLELEDLYKSCFSELERLIPDFESKLGDEPVESISYADEDSQYQRVEFKQLERRSESLYLFQIEFVNESEEAAGWLPISVKFLLDFENRICTVEDYLNDNQNEFEVNDVTRFIKLFLDLLIETEKDEHRLNLKVRNKNKEISFDGMLQSIKVEVQDNSGYILRKGKGEARTWEVQNKSIVNSMDYYSEARRIKYKIVWNAIDFESYSDLKKLSLWEIAKEHPLSAAVFKKFIDYKHYKEGRIRFLPKEHEKLSNLSYKQLSSLLEELDFGVERDTLLEFFSPRITATSIEIVQKMQGEIESESIFQEDDKFLRANYLLHNLPLSGQEGFEAEIKVSYRDNSEYNHLFDFDTFPKEWNDETWFNLSLKHFKETDARDRQFSDDQAIRFDHEIDFLPPRYYFSILVESYWRGTDSDKKNLYHLGTHTYHFERLTEVIREYLQNIDLSNPENSEIRKTVLNPIKTSDMLHLTYLPFRENEEEEAKRVAVASLIELSRKNDQAALKTLKSLLLKMMRESKKLKDLPLLKSDSTSNQKKTKRLSRIELNRSIEQLLDEKGETLENYSQEELELIKQYSGYGGSKLQETNKGLLYEYYTPKEIVQMMWTLAVEFGYQGGAICEPSCGIGNFLEYAPKTAQIEGYETNRYSAQIAQLLYPHATILNQSFEQLFYDRNTYLKGEFSTEPFDLVIGNPPYGDFTGYFAGMGEKSRTLASGYEHYFITRGLDILNSNGLLIYIIPNSYLKNSNKYEKVKQAIAEKSTFEYSWRLTKNIFKHTSIETDILVLRKR